MENCQQELFLDDAFELQFDFMLRNEIFFSLVKINNIYLYNIYINISLLFIYCTYKISIISPFQH